MRPAYRLGYLHIAVTHAMTREAVGSVPLGLCKDDLAAIKRLDEARVADLTLLRDHLPPPSKWASYANVVSSVTFCDEYTQQACYSCKKLPIIR